MTASPKTPTARDFIDAVLLGKRSAWGVPAVIVIVLFALGVWLAPGFGPPAWPPDGSPLSTPASNIRLALESGNTDGPQSDVCAKDFGATRDLRIARAHWFAAKSATNCPGIKRVTAAWPLVVQFGVAGGVVLSIVAWGALLGLAAYCVWSYLRLRKRWAFETRGR